MFPDQKIESVAEHYLKLLQIIKGYPDILEEWKNKIAVATNHSSRRLVLEPDDPESEVNQDQ
jgi:hypothetical protein